LEFEEIATMQTLTPLIQSEEIRAKLLPRQYSIQIHEMRQDEFLFYFSPFFYEFFFFVVAMFEPTPHCRYQRS
jgi:hypothetical protein